MNPKKLSANLPYEAATGLYQLITDIITRNEKPSDDDKLLFATLNEIRQKLYQKLGTHQKDYRISFTPAHAIALRLLYTDYLDDNTSYLGNRLHRLANDIHRLYY